jgi:hypothetical protein
MAPIDLFVFGSKANGPRLPRAGIDLFPDDQGMIGPEDSASAKAASTFADLRQCGLTGHFFLLPVGTELPEELGVAADGRDVRPGSEHAASHHTIFPNNRIAWQRFLELFQGLPWQYAGKKT